MREPVPHFASSPYDRLPVYSMEELTRLASKRANLALREKALRSIRRFFREQGFLEVTTPLVSPSLIPEEHIHAVEAETGFLLPSPEIHMKRLLAAGYDRIFQIGPCFRGRERGEQHLPEFTMLEWYRTGRDYMALADDCEGLLPAVCRAVCGDERIEYLGESIDLAPPWNRLTVREAFRTHAGWDPIAEQDPQRFERDLGLKVIPALRGERPCFLVDFPACEASLARRKADDPRVAERLELFAGGLELANGFSELTDPQEQRRRFEEANERRRARGAKAYPLPEKFLAFLGRLPPSAGIALGIDRLVMLLAGASRIDEVAALVPEDL
jgi:lysyl-tRNA synthetase class 2